MKKYGIQDYLTATIQRIRILNNNLGGDKGGMNGGKLFIGMNYIT